MDLLISFFKKNTAAAVIIVLLLPIGLTLFYSAGKSVLLSRRRKKESAIVYDFLLRSGAYEKAFTNEEIAQATGVHKSRVIELCADHEEIEDAGKRQRSWKLIKDDPEEE